MTDTSANTVCHLCDEPVYERHVANGQNPDPVLFTATPVTNGAWNDTPEGMIRLGPGPRPRFMVHARVCTAAAPTIPTDPTWRYPIREREASSAK